MDVQMIRQAPARLLLIGLALAVPAGVVARAGKGDQEDRGLVRS
jgi:hypothetical protein